MGEKDSGILGFIGPNGIEPPGQPDLTRELTRDEYGDMFRIGTDIVEHMASIKWLDPKFDSKVQDEAIATNIAADTLPALYAKIVNSSPLDWDRKPLYYMAIAKQIQIAARRHLLGEVKLFDDPPPHNDENETTV